MRSFLLQSAVLPPAAPKNPKTAVSAAPAVPAVPVGPVAPRANQGRPVAPKTPVAVRQTAASPRVASTSDDPVVQARFFIDELARVM